ncbi:hypothetical protein HDU83_009839, partial [Entophlyctis luteolus]
MPRTPLLLLLRRAYRPHTPPLSSSRNTGRSVPVQSLTPAPAYFQLRQILFESRVRDLVRYQEFHEPAPEKRRRKRKQADWRKYIEYVKAQVVLAKDLAL